MTTLNGWRRLWIVVSVIWLVPIVAMTYLRWPAPAAPFEIRGRYYRVADRVTGRPLIVDCNPPCTHMSLADLQKIFLANGFVPADVVYEELEIPGVGIARFPFVTFKPQLLVTDEATIAADALTRYREYVASVRQRQRTAEAVAVLAWLLPIGVIYSLGSAVAWIRRGFVAEPA